MVDRLSWVVPVWDPSLGCSRPAVSLEGLFLPEFRSWAGKAGHCLSTCLQAASPSDWTGLHYCTVVSRQTAGMVAGVPRGSVQGDPAEAASLFMNVKQCRFHHILFVKSKSQASFNSTRWRNRGYVSVENGLYMQGGREQSWDEPPYCPSTSFNNVQMERRTEKVGLDQSFLHGSSLGIISVFQTSKSKWVNKNESLLSPRGKKSLLLWLWAKLILNIYLIRKNSDNVQLSPTPTLWIPTESRKLPNVTQFCRMGKEPAPRCQDKYWGLAIEWVRGDKRFEQMPLWGCEREHLLPYLRRYLVIKKTVWMHKWSDLHWDSEREHWCQCFVAN